jgi:uncharacterized metal-binding protein
MDRRCNILSMHDKSHSTPSRGYNDLPLVYSCSGCSNAAQLANTLAVRLDRERLAEMSCIAGVGGDVKSLVRKATSGRPVIVLDGCKLHCAKNSLQRHGVVPMLHMDLSEHGIIKRYHEDVTMAESWRVWRDAVLPAIAALLRVVPRRHGSACLNCGDSKCG